MMTGVDNDCDGLVDADDVCIVVNPAPEDQDGDGYETCYATECEPDVSAADDDCDDNDPMIHPGAMEVCDDGVDNDCDGDTDFSDHRLPLSRGSIRKKTRHLLECRVVSPSPEGQKSSS